MKAYIMESSEEGKRLEQQSKNNQFSLSREISHIDFSKYHSLLDAGCGTGLLGRYILQTNPQIEYFGCDQSAERIDFAKSNCPKSFNLFAANLYDEKFTSKTFDIIVSRYVLHHLEKPFEVIKNLKSKLNTNGKLVIIDADGIMVNIGTSNSYVIQSLSKIQSGFTGSLCGARHLPELLKQAGFGKVKYRIDVMDFQDKDRLDEIEQLAQRLDFAKSVLVEILGAEEAFLKFKREYLEEIRKDSTPFYYNRFVIEAI